MIEVIKWSWNGKVEKYYLHFFWKLSKWEALVLLGQLATLQMDAYRQDLLEEKTAPSNGYSLYRGIPRELLYTDSAGYPAVVVKEALQS